MRSTAQKFKSIIAFEVTNPTGIDSLIYALQQQFQADLSFLDRVFGRVVTRGREREGEEPYLYPSAWNGQNKDQSDVMLLDNWNGYCFFYCGDPEMPDEYIRTQQYNTYTRPLSIIFRVNMEEYNPDLGYDYVEQVTQEIKDSIQATSLGGSSRQLELQGIYITPEEIFREWTFNAVKTQMLYWPYQGIRFDFLATYIPNECE